MPTWRVVAYETCAKYLDIEAETAEQAMEIANDDVFDWDDDGNGSSWEISHAEGPLEEQNIIDKLGAALASDDPVGGVAEVLKIDPKDIEVVGGDGLQVQGGGIQDQENTLDVEWVFGDPMVDGAVSFTGTLKTWIYDPEPQPPARGEHEDDKYFESLLADGHEVDSPS